ncbi:hypothetical protein [Rhizocola hellebori]|nr:hypothetical protein [Rhizocola hellebori]
MISQEGWAMDITSGGTSGPRLVDQLAALDNNVYGSLYDCPPARQLAESFVAAGWRARASSWTDYEVECEWACIELQQLPGEVIFNGVVDPSRLDELAVVFAGLDVRYSIELWNAEGTDLIRELKPQS